MLGAPKALFGSRSIGGQVLRLFDRQDLLRVRLFVFTFHVFAYTRLAACETNTPLSPRASIPVILSLSKDAPAGHDNWVVGDEPYVSLHLVGADAYAAK